MKVEMKGSAVSIALVLPIYGTTKFWFSDWHLANIIRFMYCQSS